MSDIHINVDHPLKEAVMTMVAEYNDGRKDDYLCMRYAPEITDAMDRIFSGCRLYLNDISHQRDPVPSSRLAIEMCEKVLHLLMDLNNKIYKESGQRLLQLPP